MRFRNETPTVLEFAQLFCPTIPEALKQQTDCGFRYFTADALYYAVPDNIPLTFKGLPTIPKFSLVVMSKLEQKILRDWQDTFGQPIRQVTVRNQFTKDNVGTLPIYAYQKSCITPSPLTFDHAHLASTSHSTDRSSTSNNINNHTDSLRIIFPINAIVVVRPALAAFTTGISSAPFILGKMKEQVEDDNHSASVSVEIYVPSFEDCLTFFVHSMLSLIKEIVAMTITYMECNNKMLHLTDNSYTAITTFLKTLRICVPR